MATKGQLSLAGFNFLKKEEGYRNVAYTLKGEGYPTVGFGHHSRDLVNGKYYTDEQCMAFFRQDSKAFTADVNKIWDGSQGMTQSMFDAMFSFAYNHGNISRTALGKTINNGGWKNKSKVCSVWGSSFVTGRYKAVLAKRRKNEYNFFYAGDTSESLTSLGGSDGTVDVTNSSTSNPLTSSVLENSGDNIYFSLQSGTDSSTESPKITRIYKSINPTIQLDELSIPVDGQMDTVDPSTGEHTSQQTDSSTNVDASTGSSETKGEDSTGKQTNSGSETKSNSPSERDTLGVSYPIIRINDHYFGASEIDYFCIETSGFLPTMQLRLVTSNNDLQKGNTIKEGDKCSVFVSSGTGMIKSLRCDFLITAFEAPRQTQLKVNKFNTYNIYGELFVPNLYNENMTFSFAGTSKEALEDVALKLGLGFFFCDPDNTDDTQMWYCMPDDDNNQSNNSMVKKYIQDVAQHAWKSFDAFFDCWVDPRYGLSFININKMLGEDGLDETFDVTMFSTSFANATIATDKEGHADEEETKKDPRLQVKMISNIGQDDEANTPFFAMDFLEINQTNEITKQIGIYSQSSYTIDNQGVSTDNNTYDMNYSIPYNQTKLDNGFYILVGPGQNESYNQADNGTYTDQNTVKRGGQTTDIQADSDADNIKANKSNKMSTGNVNKFYDAAYEHNRINNLFLQKKFVEVTLRGMNLGIMRGEKIPTMFIDNHKLNSLINGTDESKSDSQRLTQYMNDCTFTNLSGWFVINAITWEYHGTNDGMTPWTTRVKLIRREWPRPGYTDMVTNSEKQDILNVITVDNPLKGLSETLSDITLELTKDENYDDGEIPLDGLKDYMKQIWHSIQDAAGDANVKLVGARRYAVDEDGLQAEGNAFVKTANGYKCMDARGNILYFSTNNSRHLYGEAIDIINHGSMSFEDLLNKVIGVNGDILYLMYLNGVSLYIETSKDDNCTRSKHYHIGTDTIKQKQFWETVVYQLNNERQIVSYSGGSFNLMSYGAYKKAESEYTQKAVVNQ